MTTPIDLETGISDVREYVDDRQSRTWTDANVTRALHSAISGCSEEYVANGGDRFDEEVEVETDAGSVSLLEYDPIDIRCVLLALSSGGAWSTPLRACDPEERGADDTSNRDLKIRLCRRQVLPVTGTDILIGSTLGAARVWPAFERWVCMNAALELLIKDDERRESLEKSEAKKRAEVLGVRKIPRALPWVRERRTLWSDVRWLWTPRTAVLSLHQVRV